jgi:ribosomal protein S27AE
MRDLFSVVGERNILLCRIWLAAGIFLSNMRDSLESSLGVCVVEENSQCPECGKGSMKLIVDTAELTPQAIKTAVRARCTKCGYEDTASVKPQD